MGTIKCGHWTSRFIITPDEFEGFVQECGSYGIGFIVPSYEKVKHDYKKVVEEYQDFYSRFFSAAEPTGGIMAYSMQYTREDASVTGFFMRTEYIYIPYYGRWAEKKARCIQLSYPKAYAVDCEDGKYFVYEDILKREPEVYPIYESLTKSIKMYTKPLRFTTSIAFDERKEIKPTGVRISEGAARDLADSWIFKEYEIEMKSYIK